MAKFLAETTFDGSTPDAHAGIFSEIAELTGVASPALLFRTFSTLPGALEWSWGILRPLALSGRLQETAWALADEVEAFNVPAITTEALRAAGVDEDAQEKIRTIIAAFNRSNPFALVTAATLQRVMENGAGGQSGLNPGGNGTWTPPAPNKPSVTMIQPQDMDAQTLALVIALGCRDQQGNDNMLVPSIYRFMAHWPGYLTHISRVVIPSYESGEIDRRINVLKIQALEKGKDFAAAATQPAPQPEPDAFAETARILERFSHKIPEMIVVGRLLDEALPARGQALLE